MRPLHAGLLVFVGLQLVPLAVALIAEAAR